MGLSSKQVSGDGLDWSQDLLKTAGLEIPNPTAQAKQPPQRHPQLRCPRCDSTNTKFCYYNNYSKLQPRYFCKACRRHWTNGGTLRNVPVGGGRKNKRPKTSHQSTPTITSNNPNLPVQQKEQPQLPLAFGDILRQALLQPSSQLPSDYSINSGGSGSGSSLMGSLLSLPPMPYFTSTTAAAMISSHDSSSSGGSNPLSTPAFFSPFLNFTGQDPAEEDVTTITGSIAPWQQLIPPASGNTSSSLNVLDSSSSFWTCWDDLNGLVSSDIKHPSPQDSNPMNGKA